MLTDENIIVIFNDKKQQFRDFDFSCSKTIFESRHEFLALTKSIFGKTHNVGEIILERIKTNSSGLDGGTDVRQAFVRGGFETLPARGVGGQGSPSTPAQGHVAPFHDAPPPTY